MLTSLRAQGLSPIFSALTVVQLLSRVWLFVTPRAVAHQAFLSFTITITISTMSFLKLMSIEMVMPSNHLILCHLPLSCLQSFPAPGSFPMSQLFASGGQGIRASISASVLPMYIQDWFPLGLTGLISFMSKGLSRVLQHHSTISLSTE